MNQLNRSIFIISFSFIFASGILVAQEHPVHHDRVIPELRRRSLVFDIDAKVLENGISIWNNTQQKETIPGTPVGVRIEGSNILVSVQFTPFIRRHGHVLVAQVQLGINDPESGFSYHTSIQTIPFEFNEPIYFFPLGQSDRSSTIEIVLTVNRFTELSETSNEN